MPNFCVVCTRLGLTAQCSPFSWLHSLSLQPSGSLSSSGFGASKKRPRPPGKGKGWRESHISWWDGKAERSCPRPAFGQARPVGMSSGVSPSRAVRYTPGKPTEDSRESCYLLLLIFHTMIKSPCA